MPNLSSIAGLEVAEKFVVVGWGGWGGWGGPDRLPCRAQAKLDWAGLRQ